MLKRSLGWRRTAFGLYRPDGRVTEPRSGGERHALALSHSTFVQGRIPEFKLKHQEDVQKSPTARNHTTKFVFPRSPIQMISDRETSDQLTVELDAQGRPAVTPALRDATPTAARRGVPGVAERDWQILHQRLLRTLNDAKMDATAQGSASVSAYFHAAIEVQLSELGLDIYSEALCREVAASLTGDLELSKAHPCVLFTASQIESSGEWMVVGKYDPRCSGLERIFGKLHLRLLRQWMASLRDGKPNDVLSIRLPWVQESIRTVVWKTGVEMVSNAEAHSPRNDVQRTSRDQAKHTMDVVASLLADIAGEKPHAVEMDCDAAFMFLVATLSPPASSSKDHAAPTTSPRMELTVPEPTIDALDPRRPSELVSVDAVLEKRGLPHDFVALQLETALQEARDVDRVSSFQDSRDESPPPVQVSCKSIIDAEGVSFQRIRIHNTTLRHVLALQQRLNSGAFDLPGVNQLVDDYLAVCRRTADRKGQKHRVLQTTPSGMVVKCRLHWAANEALQAARRNGFVQLTAKERGRNQGFRDRRTGKVGSMRDDERFTEEDLEIVRERHFKLHDCALSPLDHRHGHGPLKIGDDLYGYEHRTVVTSILAADRPALEKALQQLRDDGFVNYFGRQRFSALTNKGVLTGLHLLRGEFRAAAHALIDVGEYHDFGTIDAMDDQRFNATSRRLIALLQSTADGGHSESACRDAFVHGLGLRVLKGMIAESLSHVWNAMATARITNCGCWKLVEGDIVRPRGSESIPGASLSTFVAAEPVFVTQEDLAEKRYTVHDLVLPIPGAGVVLPRNDMAGVILSTLDAHGIHMHPERRVWQSFSAQHNPLGIDMLGGYRYLLERPMQLTWTFGRDDADREPSIARRKLRKAGASWAREQDLQLELKYRLPSSAYRWSMLRELCKANDFSFRDIPQIAAKADVPIKELTPQDRHAYLKTLKSNKEHRGTERMAMAKVQASIFKTGGLYSLYPNELIRGRRSLHRKT